MTAGLPIKTQQTITVKDLKAIIADLPDDMEVIETRHSDYQFMSADSWGVVQAVSIGGLWLMRAHPTMSDENKAKAKTYRLRYAAGVARPS